MTHNTHRILVIAITVVAIHLAGAAAASAATCSIACENAKPGTPQSAWDITGAGDARRSRASPPTSASTAARPSTSRSTRPRDAYRLDIYRIGYYGGNGARQVATVTPSATLPQTQPACLTDATHRADRLRQLGGVRVVGRAGGRGLRHLLRQARPRPTDTGGASHIVVRRPRRREHTPTSCSRPPTRPGRPTTTTAATASTTGPAPTGPRLQGQLQPPVHHARRRRAEDFVFNAEYPMVRWLGAQRLRRQLHRPASTPTAAADAAQQPQDVPVGRPRRVLVGRAARQRRGGARRRRQPRVLQRQRGLLEDPLGDQHRRLRRRRTARSSATRRRTRTPRSTRRPADVDGHLARPALQPAGRRRPARERADRARSSRSTGRATTRSQVPAPTASCGSGATRASPRSPRGQTRDARRRRRSATSGTRTSTTASARPG